MSTADTPRSPWPAIRGCVVVAALCQLAWVTSPLTGSTLPLRTSFVSELFAHGQPWAGALRFVDGLGGAAALVAVVLTWRVTVSRRRLTIGTVTARPWSAVPLVAFGVFGLATVVDASSPMVCAPSISQACALAEAEDALPMQHSVHSVSSSLAVAGAAVGVSLLVIALWRRRPVTPTPADAGRTGAPRAVVTTVVFAFLAVTVWVLVELAGATIGSPLEGEVGAGVLGWAQRAQVTLSALLMLSLVMLTRGRRADTHRGATP